MAKEFTPSVIENLKYYVYCLVDPRTNRIFYIGKGKGNRLFNHANDALDENISSLKLETIREIRSNGLLVSYYIIRHGLKEEEAYLIESVLIDLLTYNNFNTETILTNIQSGHHQWDRGIKTVDEIGLIYDCNEIKPNSNDRLICININKTYNNGERENIYEATRKYWKMNGRRAMSSTFVLSVYKGIVRAVFKPTLWYPSQIYKGRWEFEGIEIEGSPYLHKSVKNIISPSQNPISYYNM
ncbi:MAG: hypothetical protein J6T83_05355 [Paludibacteraceae bacterium]|nr:hypothetical protein [Paludibacteraceae bacterium]